MRVTEHDEVDAWHFAGDPGRHVLARHPRTDRVVARLTREPGVHRDDDDVGALCPRFRDGSSHLGHDVTDDHAAPKIVAIPDHRAGSRRADDAYAHVTALH